MIFDAIGSLYDALKEWASKLCNWLKNFFKKFWGRIVSWWTKLKSWIQNRLKKNKEVVVIDPREQNGRKLIDYIKELQPNTITIDEIDSGPVTVNIGYDNEVTKVDSHSANVMQEDCYDKKIAEENGILRFTN